MHRRKKKLGRISSQFSQLLHPNWLWYKRTGSRRMSRTCVYVCAAATVVVVVIGLTPSHRGDRFDSAGSLLGISLWSTRTANNSSESDTVSDTALAILLGDAPALCTNAGIAPSLSLSWTPLCDAKATSTWKCTLMVAADALRAFILQLFVSSF